MSMTKNVGEGLARLNKEVKMKAVCILSGGMDSTTLLYDLLSINYWVHCITFNYGQRHKREIEAAQKTTTLLRLQHTIFDISQLGGLKGSLTDQSISVPHGYYKEESMKATVVPNRNQIFLSIASAFAYSEKATFIAIATHAGDHAIYPDCRDDYLGRLQEVTNLGNLWFEPIKIYRPFQYFDKSKILAEGLKLRVPYENTWTCYEGREKACGLCGACTERKEAFENNRVIDPIPYEEVCK